MKLAISGQVGAGNTLLAVLYVKTFSEFFLGAVNPGEEQELNPIASSVFPHKEIIIPIMDSNPILNYNAEKQVSGLNTIYNE